MADGPDTPEVQIENAAVQVIQFLDEEGEMRFSVAWRGDVPLSTHLGLLELAKMQIIKVEQSEED